MKVTFSEIAIIIILFGITMMATNTVLATMQLGSVSVDSQSCDSSGDNIKFSYTGVTGNQVVIRDHNGIALAEESIDDPSSGTILLPNPIPNQQVTIYVIDWTYGVYAAGSFTPNCGGSEHKK